MTTTNFVTPDRFLNKTIIITGAGAGIGRATAERVLAEGGTVVAADLSSERLDDLAQSMNTERLRTVVADVTVQSDIDQVAARADGRIDGLVNSAGIVDGFFTIAEIPDEAWERMLAVNLTSVVRMTRAVMPAMLAQSSGSIVNLSSVAGIRGNAAGVAYTSTKWAVVGLTKNTAFMYEKEGIRSNAVAPGATATSIVANMESEHAASKLQPLLAALDFPLASAAEIANAITWLLSDESSNVSGIVLSSDAGWAAQ